MTTDEALAFLLAHQPMPNDHKLSQSVIDRYDEVRRFFLRNPDPRCIAPFLMSFGGGDGLGVYQLVEDVLRQFDKEAVVPYLKDGLRSTHRSVRYWNAEIAANFPTGELIADLAMLLVDSDQDIRAAAVIALGQIKSEASKQALVNALRTETSDHIRSLARRYVA